MPADILKGLMVIETLKSEDVTDRHSLLNILKSFVKKYSVVDFMLIQGFIAKEIKYLPSPYKEELRSKWNEQLFFTFKEICDAGFSSNRSLELKIYHDFLDCFKNAVNNSKGKTEMDFRILYNLCAAYNLFIVQAPVHPVGTPFPGGFQVEKIDEEFYCPVKDKQMNVFEALCRFCIAKQAEL